MKHNIKNFLKNKKKLLIIVLIIIILLFFSNNYIVDYYTNIKNLNQLISNHSIFKHMEKYNIQELSVAIVNDFKITDLRQYNSNNKKVNINRHINKETMFQAGSTSKLFTAVLVMQLYQEGLLDINKPVNTYLKRWKIPTNPLVENGEITIKMLLNHNSGLKAYGNMYNTMYYKQEFDKSFQKLNLPIKSYKNDIPSYVSRLKQYTLNYNKKPLEIFQYSNIGYAILTLLIEDILDDNYANIAKKRIFDKLGMNRSTFDTPIDLKKWENTSIGSCQKHYMIGFIETNFIGAGALWTTPHDLSLFFIELSKSINGKSDILLKQNYAKKMISNKIKIYSKGKQAKFKEYPVYYGYGIMVSKNFITHGGDIYLFCSKNIFNYKTGNGVIYLYNNDFVPDFKIMESFIHRSEIRQKFNK